MCLALFRPRGGSVLTFDLFRHAAQAHPHGMGAMFATPDTKLRVVHELSDVDRFFHALAEANDGRWPLAVHFRQATHGTKTIDNCHPFLIQDGLLGVMHNGVISRVENHKERSDTRIFAEEYLECLGAEWYRSKNGVKMVSDFVGFNNKLIVLDAHGNHAIINESAGVIEDGVWYSNSSFRRTVDRGEDWRWPGSLTYRGDAQRGSRILAPLALVGFRPALAEVLRREEAATKGSQTSTPTSPTPSSPSGQPASTGGTPATNSSPSTSTTRSSTVSSTSAVPYVERRSGGGAGAASGREARTVTPVRLRAYQCGNALICLPCAASPDVRNTLDLRTCDQLEDTEVQELVCDVCGKELDRVDPLITAYGAELEEVYASASNDDLALLVARRFGLHAARAATDARVKRISRDLQQLADRSSV